MPAATRCSVRSSTSAPERCSGRSRARTRAAAPCSRATPGRRRAGCLAPTLAASPVWRRETQRGVSGVPGIGDHPHGPRSPTLGWHSLAWGGELRPVGQAGVDEKPAIPFLDQVRGPIVAAIAWPIGRHSSEHLFLRRGLSLDSALGLQAALPRLGSLSGFAYRSARGRDRHGSPRIGELEDRFAYVTRGRVACLARQFTDRSEVEIPAMSANVASRSTGLPNRIASG